MSSCRKPADVQASGARGALSAPDRLGVGSYPPTGAVRSFGRWRQAAVRGRWGALLLSASLWALSGCAGHSALTAEARSALDAGDPEGALRLLNEQLEVDRAEDLPESIEGDTSLLLLDRAMVLQQLGRTELSSRDLEVCDKKVELLDLSRGTADELGKYLFSDDTGPYKAPAYEKLMINTANLINYLVRGDLSGARVEARRLAIMQRYLKENEDPSDALLAPGSYLSGFVFEKSGKAQEALRYYDEALQSGDLPSLHPAIRRLAEQATFRTPRLTQILDANKSPLTPPSETADTNPPSAATAPQAAAQSPAEVLVIVQYGRVPAKEAERVPIGLALTYAAGAISPQDAAQANALAAQGLVTWVNYPVLGKARGQYGRPGFALDGQWQSLDGVVSVDEAARSAWERNRGAVVAAAITRMISRVVAGEAVRRASGEGLTGLLLSLGTQATMTAVDTPDTRSWATLPARIAIGRAEVAPGEHWIVLEARGVRHKQKVTVTAGGWAVVNLTVLG